MKAKLGLLLVVLVCAFSPRVSLAEREEQPGKFSVSLLGTGGRSLGDFGNVTNGILGLGGEIDYSLSSSIKVGASGVYRWTELTEGYVLKTHVLAGPGFRVKPRLRLYDLMIHLKWLTSSSATTRP